MHILEKYLRSFKLIAICDRNGIEKKILNKFYDLIGKELLDPRFPERAILFQDQIFSYRKSGAFLYENQRGDWFIVNGYNWFIDFSPNCFFKDNNIDDLFNEAGLDLQFLIKEISKDYINKKNEIKFLERQKIEKERKEKIINLFEEMKKELNDSESSTQLGEEEIVCEKPCPRLKNAIKTNNQFAVFLWIMFFVLIFSGLFF